MTPAELASLRALLAAIQGLAATAQAMIEVEEDGPEEEPEEEPKKRLSYLGADG